MPQLTLSVKYNVNTSAPYSSQDLREQFLAGIPNEFKGEKISDDTIDFYIKAAKELLEGYLGIKLDRQIITESEHYYSDDWVQWGFIKTTYPVACALSLNGYLGNLIQVAYPKEWLSVRRTTDGKTFSRTVNLVPVGGTLNYNNTSALYLGNGYPLMNWWRTNRGIPNYWQLQYITGFPDDKIPSDILQVLGMLATIPVLGILSDMSIGRKGLGFGVASKSISLDGLSQSVSSYSEKGLFGARMKQYSDQLWGVNGKGGMIDALRDFYSAIIWGTC